MKVEAKALINNLNPVLARNNAVVKIMEEILNGKQLKQFDFDGTHVSVYMESKCGDIENDIIDIDSKDDSITMITKNTDELAYDEKESIIKYMCIKPSTFNGIECATIETETHIIFSGCFKHISTKLNVLNSGLETNYCQEISFYDASRVKEIMDDDIDNLNYMDNISELTKKCEKIINDAFTKQIKPTYRKDTYIDRLANNPIYAKVVTFTTDGNKQYYAPAGYELGLILQNKNESNTLINRPEPGELSFGHLDIDLDTIWQQYYDMEPEKTLVFDNFRKVF